MGGSPSRFPKTAPEKEEVDAIAALNSQIVALTNLVKNNLNFNGEKNQASMISESCVFCGEGHHYDNCPGNPASVYYVRNSRSSPFSHTYNSNW